MKKIKLLLQEFFVLNAFLFCDLHAEPQGVTF